MVSCKVTGGITLGTKLKMPIFTLTYPITYKVEFWYFKCLCNRDTVQIELTKISVTKGWSDQEVNAQIDKVLDPSATRSNFHREIIYT